MEKDNVMKEAAETLHQSLQDDKILEQCRRQEEYPETWGKLIGKINDREAQLLQIKEQLAGKDAELARMDELLAGTTAELEQCDTELARRDEETVRLKALLARGAI